MKKKIRQSHARKIFPRSSKLSFYGKFLNYFTCTGCPGVLFLFLCKECENSIHFNLTNAEIEKKT